jgi:hypothetical protein
MITYDTFELPRIEGGVSGEAALDMLNAPVVATEAALNRLSMRLSNLNNKSAIIRQHVPISEGVSTGDLVYFDPSEASFKKAQATLLGAPGSNGESVEAPCSRVEGLIISTDASQITGTLLCGGYFNDNVVAELCLGSNATAGTYYLSPFDAGKAVKDTKGHLRQPVLSYHGNGELTLNVFYMAHDNHFHGSVVLGNNWAPASSVQGIAVPATATWVYIGNNDENFVNLGELTKHTTAIFYNGVLQTSEDEFFVKEGSLWSTSKDAPLAGSVAIFNHYPFAYGSPVVRGVESTNEALSVKNKNGLVQLTQNAFISGATSNSALAISAIAENIIKYTPVISDAIAGPGIIVDRGVNGNIAISSSSVLNTLLDATSINHNGTTVTSDGIYQFITFPKGRKCSFTMQLNVDNVDKDIKLNSYVFGMSMGSSISLDVECYFIPTPTETSTIRVDRTPRTITSLSIGGAANTIALGTTKEPMPFTGPGTLIARVTNTSGADTINIFRIGFKLELAEDSLLSSNANIISDNAVIGTLPAGYNAKAFEPVFVKDGKLYKCISASDEYRNTCVGITIAKGDVGEYVNYMITGIIQDPYFSFIPGQPVYIGYTGNLTQDVVDTMVYTQKIGTALTATAVQVDITQAN